MSNEKRYSVKRSLSGAQAVAPWFRSWEMARERIEYWNAHGQGGNLRIWDHSTTPPTDVTDADPDAEPEKRWWSGYWDHETGYRRYVQLGNLTPAWAQVTYCDKEIISARAYIHSATEPTLAEFAAAVKDATGVEIPVPEEPQWWRCEGDGKGGWREWKIEDGTLPPRGAGMIWFGHGGLDQCRVWAKENDRDAKRDALLAAAREAGKP